MKKLYILLLVLILVYINVNLAYTIVDPEDGFTNLFGHDKEIEEAKNTITIGSSSFKKIDNFNYTNISNNAVSLSNSGREMIFNVSEIDNTQNLSEVVSNLLTTDNTITSNQTLDENGVTVYFIYAEGREAYNADIYFNKEGKNYLISGDNISYVNSNFFINNCKDIINSMTKKEEKNGFSKF